MKIMSDTLKAIIAQDHISSFLLLKIGPFQTGAYITTTTLPYDITIGGTLFTSDARIVSVDSPKLSSPIDREAYKISLADPKMEYRVAIEEGVSGVDIKVWAGFINTTNMTIEGIPPGNPFTQESNLFMLYSGILDTQMYTISTDSEILLSLEGSSPMGPLGLKRTLITSKNWMQQHYPGDTSYDQLLAGSTQVLLLWGKESQPA